MNGSMVRCLHKEYPRALHTPNSLWKVFVSSRSLRSVSNASWHLHREAHNHFPERFCSLFLSRGMIPNHIWNAESLTIFKKPISSICTYCNCILLKKKKKKKLSLCFHYFLISHFIWKCVLLALLLSSYKAKYSSLLSHFG